VGSLIDLTGKTFGRLTVIERVGTSQCGHPRWLCSCSCGNEAIVQGQGLRSGHTQSCGCLRTEATRIHGLTNHPLYRIWKGMMHRCYHSRDTSYKYYGQRGISVYKEWHFAPTFIKDIERLIGSSPEGYTLDRIDNDGNYEPGNLRWATRSTQGFNRRLLRRNTSTRTGVSWNRRMGKWKAQMVYNGNNLFFGYFEDFAKAVEARKDAEDRLWEK